MKQKVSDNTQRFNIAIGFFGEVYKALVASMLIMFVPQDCAGESCGMTERLFAGSDGLYMAASCTNVMTLLGFMYLYYIEILRENSMIELLEFDRELPKDNESVGEALVKLGPEKVSMLHLLDSKYRNAGYIAMAAFVVNTILSAIPIINNKLDAKTYTVLMTNAGFIIGKLMEVFEVVNTPENVFYSSYLMERSQFNQVDPDHLIGDVVEDDATADADTVEKGEEQAVVELLAPSSNQV